MQNRVWLAKLYILYIQNYILYIYIYIYIYISPKLRAKYICQTSFSQNTIAAWKKVHKGKTFLARKQVFLRKVEIFLFFRTKYVLTIT